jgi:assimilatory nitrate reductase catalytic subunit
MSVAAPLRSLVTRCSYCALQCALELSVDEASGRVLRAVGAKDQAPTFGLACVKGIHAHLQLGHPERLRAPLKRTAGGFQPISWDEAVEIAAEGMQRVQRRHGKDAMALYGSGALTNEAIYLLAKFGRTVLGTANMDYNGRYCMSAAAAAHNKVLGQDRGLPFPLADLAKARLVVLVGANVAECLPPIGVQLRQARRQGLKLVVLDPRGGATAAFADLHLQPRPGTDLAVGLALLREIDQQGGVDVNYLEARSTGWREALEAVRDCSPDWCESVSGVPAPQLQQLAAWLIESKPSVILTGRGAEQHVRGPETAMAFLQVSLALGQMGRPSGGFGTLTGQGNGQGGREQGQKADQLPGYRLLADPADRAAVAAHWDVDAGSLPQPGLSAQELFMAEHRGDVRGLWVLGANPAVSAASAKEARESLAGLDFLMVSDLFLSETAELAHLVLPAAAFAEEAGTMTNLEGRVVLRRPVSAPPGEAQPDWRTVARLAQRLGHGRRFAHADASAVFEEFAACTAGGRADYSAMSHVRLGRGQGLLWPCNAAHPDGDDRLYTERFAHADGRAHLQALAWEAPSESPDADYPLRLTTGRVLQHYLTGSQTRRIPALNAQEPEAFVQVSRSLAERRGLVEGGRARVRTRRGSLDLPVRINAVQEPDTLFIPMHYGGAGCANDLTQDALSPLSKMPAFKACAAAIEALAPEAA